MYCNSHSFSNHWYKSWLFVLKLNIHLSNSPWLVYPIKYMSQVNTSFCLYKSNLKHQKILVAWHPLSVLIKWSSVKSQMATWKTANIMEMQHKWLKYSMLGKNGTIWVLQTEDSPLICQTTYHMSAYQANNTINIDKLCIKSNSFQ